MLSILLSILSADSEIKIAVRLNESTTRSRKLELNSRHKDGRKRVHIAGQIGIFNWLEFKKQRKRNCFINYKFSDILLLLLLVKASALEEKAR